MPLSTWLSTLGSPRRRAADLARALNPTEREWLRQALAAAILAYHGDSRDFHGARIAFLQRLLKSLSEVR